MSFVEAGLRPLFSAISKNLQYTKVITYNKQNAARKHAGVNTGNYKVVAEMRTR